MAYSGKNLSVLSYANGFTLWHYTTTDLATAVAGSGYFNSASGMVCVGDVILANVDTDGTPQTGVFVVVNANSAGVVDCSDFTRFDTAAGAASSKR